ncbi:MAG: hypothetical protein ACN4GM_07900 [Gammaproteobacteria bacterium]
MTEHDTDPSVEQKIDQLYRSLSTEQPPASLDRQIMAAAHRAVDEAEPGKASVRNIWLHSLAYAAVLVLAVSVIIEVSLQPELIQTEPSRLIEERVAPAAKAIVPEVESTVSGISPGRNVDRENLSRQQMKRVNKVETRARQALPAMSPEPAQAPLATEVQGYDMAVPNTELMMQEEGRMGAEPAKPWRSDPELWLLHCQQLLMENRFDALTTELAAFQRQHEQYPMPQNLSDWLQSSSLPQVNP